MFFFLLLLLRRSRFVFSFIIFLCPLSRQHFVVDGEQSINSSPALHSLHPGPVEAQIRISVGQVRRGKPEASSRGFEFSTSLKPSDSLLQIIKLFVVAGAAQPAARFTPFYSAGPGPLSILCILSTLDCETVNSNERTPPHAPIGALCFQIAFGGGATVVLVAGGFAASLR